MEYKYIVRQYKNVEGIIDLPEGLRDVEVDELILAHVDADTPEGISLEIISWREMRIKQTNNSVQANDASAIAGGKDDCAS